MSTRRLVVWITFLAVFAMAAKVSVDSDTWWHLRTGELLVEEGIFPTTDSFSHTRAGEEWNYPKVGWVMQGLLFLTFENLGFGGLNLLQALMVTAAFGFVYATMSGGEFSRAFIIVLAAAASGVFWAARPYLMTFLLSAFTYWVLEDFRWRRKNRLWLLPIIMMLWSNSHGGFAVGLIMWGIFGIHEGVGWLSERTSKESSGEWIRAGLSGRVGMMAGIGILMFLGASVNRMGVSVWQYPFETVSLGALQEFIQEWQSPNFHDLQMQPFLWLLFLSMAAFGLSEKRTALIDLLLIFVFGYLSLSAARNIAIFALVAPAVISRHLEDSMTWLAGKIGMSGGEGEQTSKSMNILNWVITGVLVLTVFLKAASVWPEAVNMEAVRKQTPVEAAAYLRENDFDGNLLNSYNGGGYLIWAAREYPVFVDGRTDLYGDEIIGEWLGMVNGESGWETVMARREIGVVLIEKGWALAKLLPLAGWEKVYEDESAVIYVP